MQEQVNDPWTAHHLVPWDHPFGGKRPCRSDVYLQTFNEPHVRLIALPETPIVRIVPDGIEIPFNPLPVAVSPTPVGDDARSSDIAAP